jgi:hypothetical protein
LWTPARLPRDSLLRRLFGKKLPPLSGAPAVRRLKTYSAQSGYVYQYCYRGQRPGEFVFDVSADRKSFHPVSVFVEHGSIQQWESGHGRQLAANERYAIAKMALFQAFDERPSPAAMHAGIRVRPADVAAILETLGRD